MVALTPAHVEEAERTVATARRLGLDSFHLLDRAAVRAEVHSPLYLGGVCGRGRRDPRSGQAGGRPRGTRRSGWGPGIRAEPGHGARADGRGGVRVRTGGRQSRGPARWCSRRAHTPTISCRRVTHRFIPLYDYILVSDPLTPAQHEAIGWRRRQGVTDGRTFFNYYRLTADDRILWGTSEAAYYAGNRVDPSCDHSPAHYAALRAELPAALPRARRPGVPLRLGRTDLLDHAA